MSKNKNKPNSSKAKTYGKPDAFKSNTYASGTAGKRFNRRMGS